MLFSEVYSCYFNAVAEILEEAVKLKNARKKAQSTKTGKPVDEKKAFEKKMLKIIQRKAFEESSYIITDALKSEEWPLVTKDYGTPLNHIPTQPLTTIQKRWMKSLTLDPRIQLFQCDFSGLEEIKPLYSPSMFVYYDRYQDGDPYKEENYIRNFRTILKALKEEEGLRIKYVGRTGLEHEICGLPKTIEYSAKDDKFRLQLLVKGGKYEGITEINVARIADCRRAEINPEEYDLIEVIGEKEKVVLELTDERDSLRRAMLHFSYLEKETMQLDEKRYRIVLYYNKNDETEVLIQILSFGPLLKVTEPEHFRRKIRERIERQMGLQKCLG